MISTASADWVALMRRDSNVVRAQGWADGYEAGLVAGYERGLRDMMQAARDLRLALGERPAQVLGVRVPSHVKHDAPESGA